MEMIKSDHQFSNVESGGIDCETATSAQMCEQLTTANVVCNNETFIYFMYSNRK